MNDAKLIIILNNDIYCSNVIKYEMEVNTCLSTKWKLKEKIKTNNLETYTGIRKYIILAVFKWVIK